MRGSSFLHSLDYYVGIPLVWLMAKLCGRKKEKVQEAKKVAFFCYGAIGDLLLASGLIEALRKKMPYARFLLITAKTNAQASQLIPGIDEHFCCSLRETGNLICYLRSHVQDIFFDMSQWSRYGALVSLLSKAKVTVGFATKGQFRDFGYSFAVNHSSHQHEYQNFLDLGRVFFPDLSGFPKIEIPAAYPNMQIAQLLEKKVLYLHMWPSGVHSNLKEWPHWNRLVAALLPMGYTLVCTGDSKNRKATEAFVAAIGDANLYSLAGKVSLLDLAWLFTKACAVISVNTGIVHLAALAGARTIALNGPTNPARWGPVGGRVVSLLPRAGDMAYLNLGFEYKKPYTNCLYALPPEDVLDALAHLGVFEENS